MTNVFLEKGDLFTGDYDAISHGANCKGVMGAGIAAVFSREFPIMHDTYRYACDNGHAKPGDFMRFHEDGKTGYNLYTQNYPGPDATPWRIYMALLGASHDITVHAPRLGRNFRLGMPLIGCGIGGVEFNDFREQVDRVAVIFPDIDYHIVYTDQNEHLVLPPLDTPAEPGVES